ncbi:hypothetical protein [Sphingomonas sp. G-3-2-10]|uniref:hypothetical protein n=1 Tax=Sphingomonas sp. G-3-2-10 TaxID=2728838 RepID=UPI00146CC819|nr:hypothetical protein [Sphingomonas sp. G-3-2-10]NML04267.1 hypothetical protein [Sphingomonas sp. G-3-2-10]
MAGPDPSAAIQIVIDPSPSEMGAKRAIAAYQSIIRSGHSLKGANDNLSSSLENLGRSMAGGATSGGKLGGVLDGIRGKAASAVPAVGELAAGLGRIGLMGGAIAAVAVAVGAIAVKSIEAASKVEVWKANLFTVTGDLKKAQDSYAALVGFASRTPFDLSQSVEGFIKLRTLGLNATEGALTSFGNTAAAMGKPLSQMIEAVADASTMEFERLKEFGIKAKQNADTVAFTFNGVTTIVKKNAGDIQTYLESIGNTKFAGAMARQMDTISGAMSNVQDASFQMFAAIGGGQLGAAAKSILQTVAAGISLVTPLLGSIGNVIGAVIQAVGSIINGFAKMFASFHGGAGNMQKGLDVLTGALNLIAQAIGWIGNTVGSVFGAIGGWVDSATSSVAAYLGLNQQAAADAVTWGDIGSAAWQMVGEGVDSAKAALSNWLSGIGTEVTGAFSGVGDWLGQTFAGPIDYIKGLWNSFKAWFGDYFKGLDFSPSGIVIGAARIIDSVIGIFRGGFNVLVVLFNQLPATIWAALGPTLQGILTGAKNVVVGIGQTVMSIYNGIVSVGSAIATSIGNVLGSILSFIVKWVNRAIGLINWAIDGANKLGAGYDHVDEVKMRAVAPPKPAAVASPWNALGGEMGKAWSSGFGNEAENMAKGLVGRAGGIRRASGSSSGGLDSGTSPSTRPSPASGGGNSGNRGSSKAADDAERKAKAEADFWKSLEGEVELAKLLPLAAEDYRKEQELQKIVGRDLNAQERERVGILTQQARTARFLTDALDKHNQAQRTIAGEEELYRKRLAGMSEDQLSVERSMLDFRNDAIARGVDLQSEGYKIAEAQARKDAERLGILKRQNDELESAIGFAKGAYGETAEGRRANASALYEQRMKNMTAARDAGALSPAEFAAGVKKAGDEFREAVGEAADGFASKLGNVLNQWGDAIGGKLGEIVGQLGSVFGSVGDFSKNSKNMADSITGLFGSADSPLVKGIGKAVGGAFAGLQIGEQIGNLGEALGLKGSGTGAKIGGALGGLTGNPLIALGASVIGGVLGAIFHKPKSSNASFTQGADGNVTVGGVRGSNSQLSQAASGAAGAVLNQLNQIASGLGGKLTGTPNLTIGTWDEKWRVLDGQQTSRELHSKNFKSGLVDFGTDGRDEAVAYAVKQAISQGIITGLPDVVGKALKVLGADAATSFAQSWAGVLSDMASITDPVGSAIKAVTDPLDQLRETMLKVGAATSDLTKLDEYRAMKLQQVLKDQTKGFQDILDQLNGDAGGFTALSQLTSQMQQMAGLNAEVAGGKTINEDAFKTLADKMLANLGSIYAVNSTEYQTGIGMIRDTAAGAISNVSALVNASTATPSVTSDPTTAAITAGTDRMTAQQGITNDLLRQILAAQTPAETPVDYRGSGYWNGQMSAL